MLKDGPYTELRKRKNNLLHTGFDYKGKIMEKTLSKVMINTNSTLTDFIYKLDPVVCDLVDSVKHIKEFANAAIEKNDTDFN